MKKLLLFAILCILPSYVFGGNINNIQIKNAMQTMGTNANEYHIIGGNQVVECDDDEGDVDNNVFLYYLSSNNTQISAKQCIIEWDGDFFRDVPIYWCSNDETYTCDNAKTIRMTETRSICASGNIRKLDPIAFSDGTSIGCVFCNTGYIKSGSDCIPATAQPVAPQPSPTQPSQPVTSICESRCKSFSGQQYVECTTCCKVPKSIADWNGKNCVCADKNTVWDTATQKCVIPTVPDEEEPEIGYTCPESIINTANQLRSTYPKCLTQIENLISYCNTSNPDATQVNTLFGQIQQCISGVDADTAAAAAAELAATQSASLRRIESTVSKLDDIASGLKLTVWRNEEGNFNTSRLLSDSIAGVVLGTAGGLITSNVVKKNQVENGFEDIQCTIGGQVVAGWGDEFRVGIQ